MYDLVTTDTSASNSSFWAGIAGGTPNAITVTDVGFNATDGSVIQFIPIATNTGPTTLNPSGFGAITIVKDTATGAVALSGGEIVAAAPSNVVSVVYSASQGNFHLLNLVNTSAPTTVQTLCGSSGLKIVNNSGTPASQITITADQTTVINASALTISRTSVSYTLNITLGTSTSAANGMDGEAPGTSAWIYIWAIDNGAQGASLASLSASAPTLPSGYSYKCRLGAMRVDGSGNLLRTIQLGNRAQYQVQSSGNTAAYPTLSNNAGGAFTTAAFTSVATAVGSEVPPTATIIKVQLSNNNSNTTVACAPNANFTGYQTATPATLYIATISGSNVSATGDIMLESGNIYCATPGSNALVQTIGWQDKVNAN